MLTITMSSKFEHIDIITTMAMLKAAMVKTMITVLITVRYSLFLCSWK
jgi:hypothetical protein